MSLGRPPAAGPPRLVIFDADDTLRRTTIAGKPCPHRPGEWELRPGVREVLARIAWEWGDPRLGVASNQDQVAYGHLSESMALRLLRDMIEAATGGRAHDPIIRCCPHAMDAACACRKPAPGMLLDILRAAGITPCEALFVGDAAGDAAAAERAGIGFRWAAALFDA